MNEDEKIYLIVNELHEKFSSSHLSDKKADVVGIGVEHEFNSKDKIVLRIVIDFKQARSLVKDAEIPESINIRSILADSDKAGRHLDDFFTAENEEVKIERNYGVRTWEENGIPPRTGGVLMAIEYCHTKSTMAAALNYRGPDGSLSDELRILGSNHGICNNEPFNRDRKFYSPPSQFPANRFGDDSDFWPIDYEKKTPHSIQDCEFINYCDVCWGKPEPGKVAPAMTTYGAVAQVRLPSFFNDNFVTVVGAKSGVEKNVKVKSISYRYFTKSDYVSLYSCWHNGIKLDKYVTQKGDSGGAYIAPDGSIIGLHRAGVTANNKNYSVAAPLFLPSS